MKVSERELRASVCRDSFWEFMKFFWGEIVPEEPVWNWHIQYLCDELQELMERMFRREKKAHDLIINISPGSTKSTTCSVLLPVWVWTRLPSARLICGSYAYVLALELSRKSRMLVQSEKFQWLFSEVALSEDQNTKGHFVTTAGGGRIAVGVGGSITGFHGHAIIVDDPLDPSASVSEADLKTANTWMRETLPTRKVDKAVTPTILIMQRLHQDDPTGEWLDRAVEGEIKHICLPAEEDENIQPPELAEKYVDGLMDPIRLSEDVLREHERILGDFGYAGQFLQRPIPRGGATFIVREIKILPIHKVPEMELVVRYWDKAGTAAGGAYTVGFLMGKDKEGLYWILDVIRGQWNAFERERIIRDTAEDDGKDVLVGVEQEPGSGGKESAENTRRNLAGYKVVIDRPTGDKETRADPWAVQVNGGGFRMVQGTWNAALLREMKYFPKSRYKDQVDAGSGAFAMLSRPILKIGTW